jgi:hypothetical protein
MIPKVLKRQQPTITPQIPSVREVPQGQKFTVDINVFQSLLLLIVSSTEAEILWSQI